MQLENGQSPVGIRDFLFGLILRFGAVVLVATGFVAMLVVADARWIGAEADGLKAGEQGFDT